MKIFDFILFRLLKVLVKLCPYNRYGDNIVHFFFFFTVHKRIPNSKRYINDFLYNLKVSNEIIKPLRVFCSDKENLKKYIKKKIGNNYNVPTLAILRNEKDIENFKTNKKVCFKPTHSSGQVIFAKNLGYKKKIIKNWLKLNFYYQHRERNYKHLKKKIIVEPILFNNTNLNDYKFFVYNKKVKFIQVDFDRKRSHKRKTYDCSWNDLKFSAGYKLSKKKCERPEKLKKMINIAEKIGEDFNFIRVDMYTKGRKIYIGELTNCPTAAHAIYFPRTSEPYASKKFFKE